ncbi:MAG: LysR substrate-binding domain-containing protein [Zavarzinia sp.]|nr:LysR substrate-binding domain-containing protein [Zavarzinia sp.]
MRRNLPPLNAMRAFEAAYRHESFARAAVELNVAQAAVSRHVRDFEIWLGHPLFERHARGVRLTAAGRRLGGALVPVLDALSAAIEAERPRAPGGRPRVTVTVEPVIARCWLVRRLGLFREAHPDIDIELDPTDRLTDFTDGTADLGIRFGAGPWPAVEAERLVEVEVYPVAAPAIAAQLPAEPTMADLRRFTLLHEDRELWARFERATGAAGPMRPPSGLMLQDAQLAIEAAAMGQGIALGDSVLDFDIRKAGGLIRLTRRSVSDHAYWLVGPRRRAPSRPARLFRDWLRETLAADMAEAALLPINKT